MGMAPGRLVPAGGRPCRQPFALPPEENVIAIEHAFTQAVRKPWGSADLRPWSALRPDGVAIGELWFQRADRSAPDPALLLKLLFTTASLSIQVHPDDSYARSIGLAHGKTEAWYILSAAPDAEVATGLKRRLTSFELRAAIEDRSIAGLVQWRRVREGDTVYVPAGTIHAIGAGLVLAEIQQRSDATFRLFDHGRGRELHVENAVAAAKAGPAPCPSAPRRLTNARTLLVASPHFVLEQLDLAPQSNWGLRAEQEAWILALDGGIRVGAIDLSLGEAAFVEADHARIRAHSRGFKGLLAYPGPEPRAGLLRRLDGPSAASQPRDFLYPSIHHRAAAGSPLPLTKAYP